MVFNLYKYEDVIPSALEKDQSFNIHIFLLEIGIYRIYQSKEILI
jgi:hypothetical protein